MAALDLAWLGTPGSGRGESGTMLGQEGKKDNRTACFSGISGPMAQRQASGFRSVCQL
jgi:hypothetical protein